MIRWKKSHQTSKFSQILQTFHYYIWDIEFGGFEFKIGFTNFLGTTIVPILLLNPHNSLQFLNKIHQRTVQMWLYGQTWYPKWYPKHFFEKFTFWTFQRRVNHVYSHTRSKVTYRSVFMIFWYSIEFSKISLFLLKLCGNLQSL